MNSSVGQEGCKRVSFLTQVNEEKGLVPTPPDGLKSSSYDRRLDPTLMEIFVPKEADPETRAALSPDAVKKLTGLGATVTVESGLGHHADWDDAAYESAGASVTTDREAALTRADIVAKVRKPDAELLGKLKTGALYLSFLDPFNSPELMDAAARNGVNVVSMEMIPRTTLAQKMDALSSQANLAGYYAVIKAVERLSMSVPMMMTPAGTLSPAKVFVIGVGVAGLQAIATAKRLGCRVEAFDTRPVVEEQVKSLGAKFVKIDLGETGQTAQGYAKELTPEQIEKQQQGMAKVCGSADIVITTAKLFGRKAPTLVNERMLAEMRRGSVVIDLAAESGGNVEGTKLNEEVVTGNGVRIIGIGALEAEIPRSSSQMYASNVANFLEHFWGKESKAFEWRRDDPILSGCLLTYDGQIVHERFADKPANT